MISAPKIMAKPIFRKITKEIASQFRELSYKRQKIQFNWLDKNWKIFFQTLTSSRENLSEFRIDWGGAVVIFRCDENLVEEIIGLTFGVYRSEILQESMRKIAIEAGFAHLSDIIQNFTRKRFEIGTSVEFQSESEWNKFEIELDCEGLTSIGELWLDQLGLRFLSAAVRSCPFEMVDFRSWRNIYVQMRFLIGSTQLPIVDLQNLNYRDVILLDECELGSELNEILVVIGMNYMVVAKVDDRKLTTLSSLEKCVEDVNADDAERYKPFGELSIQLTFDLGEQRIKLSELAQIGPGHVFELSRLLRREVMIRANGKLIGEGEIVDVDGRVGVAVLQLDPQLNSVSD